ncbi:MAG: type II secretion system F family protein [Methanoregulaceae archaeon]|jgi:type II secretory pathway component PulF|nr:type II secretion system F family protein [Methanoregulaceae archaeon]
MTTFAYTALDPAGKKRSGFVEAADQDQAIAKIVAEGRFVVDIRPQGRTVEHKDHAPGRGGKINKADIALFTRRLADLSSAGLPLDRGLQVVAEQSESARLTQIAEEALEDVRSGLSVSQALSKHPKVFNEVYTQTLRAGEASGQFPEVATRLAEFQETEVARRSQIVSALIYPGVLTFTAVMVVVFLLTFVVPRLSGVFEDLGDDLPASTKILLATTGFLTENALLVLLGMAGTVVLYRIWSATEPGAMARDRFIMKLPAAGPVIAKAIVSRFARVLGTLVYGGVPILEALQIAGMSAGNRLFKVTSEKVAQDVREGRPIAEAMRDSGGFPPVLVHMVAIGEETGDLPKMLGRVSDSLDFEVDNGMRRLTALVEPTILLTMGVFVGFVVLSVVLPIFQAQDLVK